MQERRFQRSLYGVIWWKKVSRPAVQLVTITRSLSLFPAAYRFQLAGYKNESEYLAVNRGNTVERWPHNNYVKKLRRKDGRFYYFNKARECSEKDLPKVKLYTD